MTESLRALAAKWRKESPENSVAAGALTLRRCADELHALADRLASPGAGAVERWEPSWIPRDGGIKHFDGMVNEPEGDYVLYTDHTAALAARDAEIAGLREELGSTKVILECARRDIAKWRKHTEGLAQEMNDVRTLLAPLFKNVDPMPGDSMIGVSRTVTLYGYASDVAKQLRALRQRVEAAEALVAKWRGDSQDCRRFAQSKDNPGTDRIEANVESLTLERAANELAAAQQAEPTGGNTP